MKRGYLPTTSKPVSYLVRKGYTDAHTARYKAKTGKFKVNHKTETRQVEDNVMSSTNIKNSEEE